MEYRKKKNLDIRALAKAEKVTLAEVAAELNEPMSALSVELRRELSGAEKARMIYAIRSIAGRRGRANDIKGVREG